MIGLSSKMLQLGNWAKWIQPDILEKDNDEKASPSRLPSQNWLSL